MAKFPLTSLESGLSISSKELYGFASDCFSVFISSCTPTCSPALPINAHPHDLFYFSLALLILCGKVFLCSACPMTPSSCYQILLKFYTANLSLLASVQAFSSPFPAPDNNVGYTKTARTGENCLPTSSEDFRQCFHMQEIYSQGNASQAFSPTFFHLIFSPCIK